MINSAAILGGGSWGTAIAGKISKRLKTTNIYLRQEDIVNEINSQHSNNKYLNQVYLPKNLKANHLDNFSGEEDIIFVALPAVNVAEYLKDNKKHIREDSIIILASKGFSYDTKTLFVEEVSKILPANKIGMLSGPNFAHEVALGYPSASALAFLDINDARIIADIISTQDFVIYPTDDIITLQVGGFMKNIVAIVAGILDGLKYGENTKAWLISKAINEIEVVVKFFAPNVRSDLMHVGVLGDLVLTCYSLNSRNTKFGHGLARSKNPTKYLSTVEFLTEGTRAAKCLNDIAKENNLNLPIVNYLADVLTNPRNIKTSLNKILSER
ncbi:MAG: NAD(P)H-dependent glycerol-3-phosphate dehydrogenase [Rickettsiaceae bacterium]|nr:NAD(P)H-dependent glycerol-3-phosphate dehydrogenase [Rickettsiaceae bacterium]